MLENNGKIKITYTKDMLIKKIAEEYGIGVKIVRSIYNLLEENIFEILSSANLNTDVSVRLFEGISIDSSFLPEKTKLNNLTGETIIASSKIKPKVNITRNYCEKLANFNK